ncbi:MAG: CbtB-domain containing protein [Boseongicola sp.]|nr:CbtB-domain containing protein [Boseongicola sp.]MDD9978094.1 CbtB-domain containing protein [Boseongicola sp.]
METTSLTSSASKAAALVFVMLTGALLVTFSGHVQASTLHAAAHDVRHANGFPCH